MLNKEEEAVWEAPLGFDRRDYFIKIPESKCPEENFMIPNVDDFLTPSVPSDQENISG